MTKQLNRCLASELKTLRIRKKGSGKTIELDASTLLQVSDGDEFNDIRILNDFQEFQKCLARLKEKKTLKSNLTLKFSLL